MAASRHQPLDPRHQDAFRPECLKLRDGTVDRLGVGDGVHQASWRGQGRSESLPEDYLEHSDPNSDALPEKRAMEMTIQQALGYLQPRCRETLRLHYFEGRSAPVIASELDTTNRYAEKLIHNCLKRVREIYINITAVNR